MHVLIKISDEEYKKISNSNPRYADDFSIYYAIKNGTPINAEDVEAFDMAIRDHQLKNVINKIREIVDKWRSDTWTDNLSYECMIKIAELVESPESEGKDD